MEIMVLEGEEVGCEGCMTRMLWVSGEGRIRY